ncbi:Valacyclovir hydrolase [Halotydeus destructor]|nr:Valacyclovir hydrolase [Halotydeus destructor]
MSDETFKSGKLLINDCDIYYEIRGAGEHVLLLIPGALGSTETHFSKQHEGFDKDKFTMVSVDPPGYGQSRPPMDKCFERHYWTDADTCQQLMAKLGYSRYSIVGFSDGGRIGLVMAANYTENVKRVVGWGCSAYVTREEREYLNSIRDPMKWSTRKRLEMENLYGEDGLKTLWNRFVDCFISYEDILTEELKKIKCPVFILHGDKDPIILPEHTDYMACIVLSDYDDYHIAEGGHDCHISCHQEFNQVVQKVLLD